MVISFKSYIKDSNDLNELKAIPTDKDIEDSKRPLKWLVGIKEDSSFLPVPPKNSSDQVEVELELLEKINNRLNEEDLNIIKKYDTEFLTPFYEILDEYDLEYNKEKLEELRRDVETVTLKEKIRFNRPRPSQLGPKFGILITDKYYNESKTSKTPSYPSGHSSQSMFIALCLSEQYPNLKGLFMETANDISNSRILSSLHYPIDSLAGQTLAHVLYNNHYKKHYNQRTPR